MSKRKLNSTDKKKQDHINKNDNNSNINIYDDADDEMQDIDINTHEKLTYQQLNDIQEEQ